MDDADMYVNDGAYWDAIPAEPTEQVESRKNFRNKGQAAKPLLLDIIQLLEADIALFSSIDAITVDVDTEPEAFLAAWHRLQDLKAYAISKKEYIQSLIPDK